MSYIRYCKRTNFRTILIFERRSKVRKLICSKVNMFESQQVQNLLCLWYPFLHSRHNQIKIASMNFRLSPVDLLTQSEILKLPKCECATSFGESSTDFLSHLLYTIDIMLLLCLSGACRATERRKDSDTTLIFPNKCVLRDVVE